MSALDKIHQQTTNTTRVSYRLQNSFIETGKNILQLLSSGSKRTSGYDTLYAAYGLMENFTGRPFMNNYGYAPTSMEGANRFQLQMYSTLFDYAQIAPDDSYTIGEIGCGQGWGARYLLEDKFTPTVSFYGIDQSKVAIRHCQRHRAALPQAHFQQTSDSLPFSANFFDYFFSIETSAPRETEFLQAIFNCVKPGGRFIFYETYTATEILSQEEQLTSHGFKIIDKVDITDNVVAALIEDNLEKVSLTVRAFFIPYRLKKKLFNFVALPGTQRFAQYYSKERLCHIYVLEKPRPA